MTDPSAFEEFVRRYQDMVYGTAVRLVADPSEAEDIAQSVFLKAFERFEAIGTSPAAAGWLKTVTTNLSLNHLTRFRRRWRQFARLGTGERSLAAQSMEETLPSPDSPAADLERAEESALLERSIRSLPDHQRIPLVLFHFEDRSYGEIAKQLGISLAKVKSDIHRGRQALRRIIEGER